MNYIISGLFNLSYSAMHELFENMPVYAFIPFQQAQFNAVIVGI